MSRRSNTKIVGGQGEERAVHWLEQQGFTICTRNLFWCKHEIDIIALKNGITYLFEVKTIQSIEFLKVSMKQRLAYESYILKHLADEKVECYVLIVHGEIKMVPMEI